MLKARLILLASLFFASATGFAQNKTYKNEFGFRSDNDSFLGIGQDRYYTNGLFISFRHATDQSKLSEKMSKKIWEIEAGHMIFNPFTGQVTDIRNIDRPFAAYLYAGGAMNWMFRSENSLRASLQVGTIGPAAYGEEVQATLHDLIGFYEIRGWEYQVKNETGINAALAYNHFLGRNKTGNVDLSGTSEIKLGNTFAGASAGVMFRAGSLNNYNNSVTTNSRIANNAGMMENEGREFFFFMNPQLHFVAYNATVQGGMFREDKGPVTYNVKPLVFSQEMGANYGTDRWTFQFAITLLSKEIQSRAKAQQFGTAKIYYRFN